MSVGQVVGGVVGAVVGFFVGGPSGAVYGAQLGIMAGSYIDPPDGPTIEGPRLTDLTVQTSTYGAPKTRAYGTVPITGNVFWLEGNKYTEHPNTSTQGGKGGGGGATTKTYSYSATFAVSLTEGQEITGIRRLWIGDNLVYDAGSDQIESILASNLTQNWKLYRGTDDQQPDPRMQADVGVANCPSYPGRAYIVFYDLDLTEKYSNTLLRAQVKAEVVCSGSPDNSTVQIATLDSSNPFGWSGVPRSMNAVISGSEIKYIITQDNNWDGYIFGTIERSVEYGVTTEVPVYCEDHIAGAGYLHSAPALCFINQSDRQLSVLIVDKYNNYDVVHIAVYENGALYEFPDDITTWKSFQSTNVAVEGENFWFAGDLNWTRPIERFIGGIRKAVTASSYNVTSIGYGESYLFATAYSGGSGIQTVYKFDKYTLELVDTYIQSSFSLYLIISVESDDVFYTKSYGHYSLFKWVGGNIVDVVSGFFPNLSTQTIREGFKVFNSEQYYGVYWQYDQYYVGRVWVCHQKLESVSAKLHDIVSYECEKCKISNAEIELSSLINSDVRGYRISGVQSPRAALEPLQAAWPFDVYQKGYKIGFKSRGSASVAAIEETDLGTTGDGESSRVLLPVVREMETQIALTVTVKHLDASRDYEIGEQTAPERPGVSSVEPRSVDLPIVLTADEAIQIADVLNSKEWTERVKFGPFSLPPTHANLEPTDIVTINHRNRSWEARLTRAEYLPDGRLNCEAVLTSSAAYSSAAVGSDPISLGKSLVPLAGSSRVILLDIPRIDASQDVPGISAVMYGFTTSWPGGVLVRSDDSGNTWQSVAGFDTKAEVFTATNSIAAATTNMVDWSSVLNVTPEFDAADLFSITDAQLFAGGNMAAYGADGRWEIVCFKTASLASGTYTLTNFLRGRYGTEWAMTLHQTGDYLVMLDTETAEFIGLPTTALNSLRIWRGVTQGATIESAANIENTYGGVNLKPLSPVYLNGSRNPDTLAWTASVTPRTRFPVEVFSGVDAPVGESPEAYVFELWDSGYSTLKRTVNSATPSITYTQSEQIEDSGTEVDTLYLKARSLSAVVGSGYSLQDSIYRYIPLDTFGDQVVFLQYMQDTGLSDYRGHTITLSGNTARSGTQYLFAGNPYSAYLDGVGDAYYTNNTNLALGTGDFTIEFAVRPDVINVDQCIFDFRPVGTSAYHPMVYLSSTGQIVYFVNNSVVISGAHGISANNWLQGALIRSSGVTKLFIGSTQVGSNYTDSNNYIVGTNRPIFGINGYNTSLLAFKGYIQYIRITKAARNPALMPPTAPFPIP